MYIYSKTAESHCKAILFICMNCQQFGLPAIATVILQVLKGFFFFWLVFITTGNVYVNNGAFSVNFLLLDRDCEIEARCCTIMTAFVLKRRIYLTFPFPFVNTHSH